MTLPAQTTLDLSEKFPGFVICRYPTGLLRLDRRIRKAPRICHLPARRPQLRLSYPTSLASITCPKGKWRWSTMCSKPQVDLPSPSKSRFPGRILSKFHLSPPSTRVRNFRNGKPTTCWVSYFTGHPDLRRILMWDGFRRISPSKRLAGSLLRG